MTAIRALRFAIPFSLAVPGPSGADELSVAAVSQLGALVECMKQFDSSCIVDKTYMRVFEQRGLDLKKAKKRMIELQDNLKSIGTTYSRFDITDPGSTFTGDGKRYALLPYSFVMESQGHRVLQEAFFIGFSEDDGKTWKFLDGISTTQENIRMFIPSYSGAPLPDRRMRPLEQ